MNTLLSLTLLALSFTVSNAHAYLAPQQVFPDLKEKIEAQEKEMQIEKQEVQTDTETTETEAKVNVQEKREITPEEMIIKSADKAKLDGKEVIIEKKKVPTAVPIIEEVDNHESASEGTWLDTIDAMKFPLTGVALFVAAVLFFIGRKKDASPM